MPERQLGLCNTQQGSANLEFMRTDMKAGTKKAGAKQQFFACQQDAVKPSNLHFAGGQGGNSGGGLDEI